MTKFEQLLESTIGHIERLRRQQVRYLPINRKLVESLRRHPSPRPSPAKRFQNTFQKIEVEAKPAPPLIPKVEKFDKTPLSPAEKSEAITNLRKQALACVQCKHLASSRRNVVFGIGSIHAKLMFVGEAPGLDEDDQGEPFVGKAGQLLTKIIQTMELTRDKVYITNVLKCRPDTPGRKFGNRPPTTQEMATCRHWLIQQIRAVQPKVIAALGATAVKGLLGLSTVAITKYRGQFQDFGGIPLMPTYHPAYILRNPSPRIKRQIWEDMLQIMETLHMPLSQKQRNYFTKNNP